jgi:hypothetical protein
VGILRTGQQKKAEVQFAGKVRDVCNRVKNMAGMGDPATGN